MQPRKRRPRLTNMEVEMPGTTLEAGADVLRIPVAAVEPMAGVYERLGLHVRRLNRRRAIVELPCGITLVLWARAAHGTLTPAA